MAKADKEAAKKEGAEREAAWRALGPKEQLAALDRRLGKGQGAKKQRARIAKAIEEAAKEAASVATKEAASVATKGAAKAKGA